MTHKEEIVEEMGVYFEQAQNISPLAARIKSLLLISSTDGYSFDEIVDFFKSSKSSISTNIKHLLDIESIEYFTKPGERKRYFRSKQNYLQTTLKRFHQQITEELVIVKKINKFNKKYNPSCFESRETYGEIYREILEKSIINLDEALTKMEELRTNNKLHK